MRNKLRSLPLGRDFTLSSLKLYHRWITLYSAWHRHWLTPPLATRA